VGVELSRPGPRSGKRLDVDPQLAVELAVCADFKIFHSEFLAKLTSDRDKAIWWYARKAKECPVCHTRPEEWDESQGGHRRAYVGTFIDCEGCIVLERTQCAPEISEIRGRSAGLIRNPELE